MGMKSNSNHFHGTNGSKGLFLKLNIQLFAKKPDGIAQQKHVGREAVGHLPDNAITWALLEKVSSDEKNFVGYDKFGNKWYSYVLSTGKQIWVKTRNDIIQDGGKNPIFKPMTPDGIKKKVVIIRGKRK